MARDDDLTLFLDVLRELLFAELIRGPEVPLVLPRAPPTVLRAVFVALLTLRLRDMGAFLDALDDLFPTPVGLAVAALFLRMLADLEPLDTLAAALTSLLPRFPPPRLVFKVSSSLPNSLAS
ncbi:MAG: hypothetical protein J2P21_11385 [Chloracidobacterium sp.]|nr:hypothetical protein [Chloracidobacterium sp.]